MTPRSPDGSADIDLRARLQAMPPDRRARVLATMGLDDAEGLDLDWPSWAHKGQREPPGDWRTWVIMAGRGFGKTRAGSEWVAGMARAPSTSPGPSTSLGTSGSEETVLQSPPLQGLSTAAAPIRIALVAATLDEARRIMVEGESGLLAVAGDEIAAWHPSRRTLRFVDGAEATLFSGASPDALRGPEHHIAWCDELAKWERPGETWDMLQLGLRLGDAPRALVTTTPRPGAHLRRIMAAPGCVVTGGRTRANPHLPETFIETVETLYAGTRRGRQELDGELLTDSPGALWTVALIERCRFRSPSPSGASGRSGPRPDLKSAGRSSPDAGLGWGTPETARYPSPTAPPPSPPLKGRGELARTLIAVDPPSGDGTCGIIACGLDAAGIAHVLADHSVTARSPEGWARAVADAARIHGADLVVAEQNQGGRMVEAVLRTADPTLRVRSVTATVGKAERAAPVAMLFEAGKVVLHARFAALEAELLGMIAGGDYEGPGPSPDRADAMVWGLTELMLQRERAAPRVRAL